MKTSGTILDACLCLSMGLLDAWSSQTNSDQKVAIREKLTVGVSLEVSSSVNLQGKLIGYQADGKEGRSAAISASAICRYRERILEMADSGEVLCVARRYLSAVLDKKHQEHKEQIALRPGVERILIRRANDQSIGFSPDGLLTEAELDLIEAEAFTTAFGALLPNHPVQIGDRWTAKPLAIGALIGVDPVESGSLNSVLRELNSSADGTIARINLSGTLTGRTDHGPTRMSVEGHYLFDLDTQLITYVLANGRSEIVDDAGRKAGQFDGRYEITRRPTINDPRLSDSALAGLSLRPTRESTALLFESKDLGVRFNYPRNWDLRSVAKNVIELDERTGGSMRLTLDVKPAPSAEGLQRELANWLKSQKAVITESGAIAPIALGESRKADRFTVRAALKEQPKEWTYLVMRQGERNASVAANLVAARTDVLRDDVLFVARQLEFIEKPR